MPDQFASWKRKDRIQGAVLTVGLFLMWTGSVPPVLQYSGAALAVVWLLRLLLRPSDRAVPAYPERISAFRRNLESLNFRYALARVVELNATLVAALALWTARQRLPARIPPIDARLIVSLVLSLVAAGFLGAFALSVSRGDPIEVRSQWGGLGGAAGGWRISRPMVCLMAAAVFGGLTAVANLPVGMFETSKLVAVADSKSPSDEASKGSVEPNKGTSAPPEQKPATPAGAAAPAPKQ